MIAYAYRAVHETGRIHKGRLAAAHENELAFLLREMKMELIDAKEMRDPAGSFLQKPRRVNPADRIALCYQLADMLESGVPLAEAMETLTQTRTNSPLHESLLQITQNVRAGRGVQESFANGKALFDTVALAMLGAGEQSGNLAATFSRIGKHLQDEDRIKRELRRALRYPLFLLGVACGVITFMMALVVPQMTSFLTGLGQDLPLSTRFLVACAELFAALWWSLPLGAVLGWALLHNARRYVPRARIATDRWLLALPALGPVLHKLALTRLTASLSLLIHNGLTVPEALQSAGATLDNAALEQEARQARRQLAEGAPLSVALATLFPLTSLTMLRIGETSGHLTRALDRIAQSYDREAKESVDLMLGTLEPALTLLVGSILAWIVLAVLGPVYGALTPLSQGMM